MRQEKKTKAMLNRRYWLGLSLASAATLASALISTGTVQAENKSIPDWLLDVKLVFTSLVYQTLRTTLLSLMIQDLSRFRKHLSMIILALLMKKLVIGLEIESFFTRVNTMHLILIDLYTKFGMIQENKFRRI